MTTIQRIGSFWWILLVAAIAVLVPTASAQARPTQAAARSGMAFAERSARASTSSLLTWTGVAGRSLRPTAVARGSANNPATYTDPIGDSGTAPDIQTVVASNDDNGTYTFGINVARLTLPSDVVVLLAIDSDQNPATGASGFDYIVACDESNDSVALFHWDGSQFVTAPNSTLSASDDNTGVAASFNRSDIGNAGGLNFRAETVEGATPAAGHLDLAPDTGTWNYQLGPAAALTLSVELAHTSKARAGKPFVAVITVARSDGALADVTVDDVTCAATVGRRALHAGSTVALGPAVGCSWRLPKKARGKTLHASVTVTLDGATTTKTFTARIT